VEESRRQIEITKQVRRIATREEIEAFRKSPLSVQSFWLLVRALKLWVMSDTTAPEDRAGLILHNISLTIAYTAGLGQNTSKRLAGDDIPWCKVRSETSQNLLAAAGWTMRAATELHQFASASKGFQTWVAESDLRQISEPISEWESAASGAQKESGLYQGPQKLARGNFGERAATEALAADGHTILSYKPDVGGTNQGGIDMVTLRNGVVHFIDNKALTRSGNVSSVSALTTNFAKNRAAVVQEFTQYLNDLARPAAERAMFQRAVDDINKGKFVRAVTNANLAPNTAILSDVSDQLKKLGLVFIDVMH
jgi:hypothetical protein